MMMVLLSASKVLSQGTGHKNRHSETNPEHWKETMRFKGFNVK